ncbi:MAG: 1-acyl-sn-glycerol-3-phosphate acyltransferase [Spirochaetaceae bacterium]|jgi:glycerol-3-phosphate O-acyltransferase|nr:1-acyl-sn-glycerol-3-phosphate acyltransferase [Spirochaetaceae bacterium]
MDTLTTTFPEIIKEAVALSNAASKVTEGNVYQTGNSRIRPLLDKMVDTLVLPGSGIGGMENIRKLYGLLKEGHSCLLLLEHYSNMDLSLFDSLLRKEEGGGPIADTLVAIAGMKLTEDSPVVAAFASAYTRLVISPSRLLQSLDPEKDKEELIRSAHINRAATRALIRIKEGEGLVLVFPSGTRYRPWDPSSKRGVREIDSYIRLFEYMCPVAINGEVLHVRQGDMMEDSVSRDLVRLTAGPVISCSAFREDIRIKAEKAGVEDKKQAVVDAIMDLLEEMHTAAEALRQELLKGAPGNPAANEPLRPKGRGSRPHCD